MKNTDLRKLKEAHTNRLLVSVAISFALLIVLLMVHMAQLGWHYMEARAATFVISILFAAGAVALTVACVMTKKKYLSEYIGLSVVMAFCFYCVHGVSFVRADIMKYATGLLTVIYLVGTYIYHTLAPKMAERKSK